MKSETFNIGKEKAKEKEKCPFSSEEIIRMLKDQNVIKREFAKKRSPMDASESMDLAQKDLTDRFMKKFYKEWGAAIEKLKRPGSENDYKNVFMKNFSNFDLIQKEVLINLITKGKQIKAEGDKIFLLAKDKKNRKIKFSVDGGEIKAEVVTSSG